MKTLILLTIIVSMLSFEINAQNETDKLLSTYDFIVGDYAISIKDKKIGRFSYFDCSTNEMCAECCGYFEIPKIDYKKTKLYVIGKKVLFTASEAFDTKTLSVIEMGETYKIHKKDAMYLDKDGVYRRLYKQNRIDDSSGFKQLVGRLLLKNNELYFANDYHIEKINKSQQLDFKTLKIIKGNFFMDKNGCYFINSYDIDIKDDNTYFIDYIKLDDKQKNDEIITTKDYCVINTKVYSLNSRLEEIKIDYKNIKKIELSEFDGKIALSDKNNIFYRYSSTYSIDKIDRNDENNSDKLYCIEKNFSKIKLLRKTPYSEYHYDIDNGIIYLDHSGKTTNFQETSGDLYKTSTGFYLNNPGYYTTAINEVKIWNPQTKIYENLDLDQYQYVHNTMYYYKGNLYEQASKLVQKNFNIEALKVFETYKSYYVTDNKKIIGFEHNKNINLNKLSVLKMPDGEPTNYLTDGNSLIYEKRLIENFENKDVHVINQDLIVTKNYIYTNGDTINRRELAIPIVFLSNN